MPAIKRPVQKKVEDANGTQKTNPSRTKPLNHTKNNIYWRSFKFAAYSTVVICLVVFYHSLYKGESRSTESSGNEENVEQFKGIEIDNNYIPPIPSEVPQYYPLQSDELKELPYKVIGTVPKIKWKEDLAFAWECVERGSPIVLTNTMVNAWNARKWTPDYIATHFKQEFNKVYKHSKRIFGPYWDPGRPMTELKSISRQNAHEEVKMSPKEFVTKITESTRDPSDPNYYYYSANVNEIGDLVEDIWPFDFLELNPESESQNANFWIGQNGTIAHTHYDAYENFNIQIYGKKKWTLFAPNEPLYLYPFLHPSHAQAQVLIDFPDFTKFPKFKEAKALQVIMEPGDVLYLPPLWFHHVEAIERSISVNVWSFTPQSEFLMKAIEIGLDQLVRDYSITPEQFGVVIRQFIILIIEEYKGIEITNQYISDLIDTRYRDLLQSGQLPSKFERNQCNHKSISRKDLKTIKKGLLPYKEKIIKLLNELPENTRDVWLSNYIEYLAMSVSRDVIGAAPYLLSCFEQFNSNE